MSASQETPQAQPKTVQRLLLRTAMLLFTLAALFFGFRYFQRVSQDVAGNLGSASTVGQIAAIQFQKDGSEAVIIKGQEIKGTSSWKPGSTDRDITWSPDGHFLYFVSDRKDNGFHVLRWSPDSSDAEARTVGRRSRSNPAFATGQTDPEANATMLLVSAGVIQEFDPIKQSNPQVLPPIGAEITQSKGGDEQGTEGQFAAMYGSLGSSFRVARWCKGKKFIAAIMRREQGEVMIIQSMTPVEGRMPAPIAVAAGDRIDLDVNPKDGSVVYSVQGWRWPSVEQIPPEFRKGNHITTPVRHQLAVVDPESKTGGMMLGASKDDKSAFGAPAISPDGSTVIVTVGGYSTEQQLDPMGLIAMPIRQFGIQGQTPLVRGAVYEPSWSPDGSQIAFARRDKDGHRTIYTISKSGGSERNVTGGKGDFAYPKFSPQLQ